MTQRRWKLVVTELGSSDTLHDVVVEAGDWMTALGRARTAVGERGGVPPGASCAVAPDGTVTILDGVARRQYALLPTEEALRGAPPAAAKAAPAAGAPKRVSKQTVAYMASPFGAQGPAVGASGSAPASASVPASVPASAPASVPAPASAPVSASAMPSAPATPRPASVPAPAFVPRPASVPAPSAAPDSSKGKHKHTVAYLPSSPAASVPAAPPPAQETSPAVAPAPAIEPAAVEPATVAPTPVEPPAITETVAPLEPPTATAPPTSDDGTELLYARDGERSAETPLTYRERTFLVPAGTSADDAELLARRQFAIVREALETSPKGKLVNIAVFDHRWEGRPERAPLVTLQWKDWRGEAEIQRPSELASMPPPSASLPPPSPSMPPAAPSTPPQASAPSTASTPPRRRADTPSPDERLTQAFEALQDLFFLGSPLEGAEFVLNLLNDLVPCEASSVCIYDINTDELRLVALRGTGGDERRGEAIPMGIGLIGAAARDFTRPMLVEDVSSDPRFDPGVDGRVGLDATTMALVPCTYQGALQALVQLVNRAGQAQFSKGDANVLVYLGEKLGEFLHQSRLATQERPSMRPVRR